MTAMSKSESSVGKPRKGRITHNVIINDSSNMKEVKSESIHLVVTSPPYWNLKKYSSNGLGSDEAYEEYLSGLKRVFAEAARTLIPGRFMVINVGTAVSRGDMKPINGDIIHMMHSMGFTFKKEIIWVKPKGTQGLWQRGTTKFLKTEPYPCFLSLNIQHEYILIFQKQGDLDVRMTEKTRLTEEFIKKMAWSVWEMRVSRTKGHPAPFPEDLPRRIIQLYTNKGETVLDPFGGTGTTSKVCCELERNSYLYEINREYKDLIVNNMSGAVLRGHSYKMVDKHGNGEA